MAEKTNIESTYISFRVMPKQRQKSSDIDRKGKESLHEDVIQGTKNDWYCRLCENRKCKMDIYKVKSLLKITLALRYLVGTEDTRNVCLDFECNFHEYMVWQYLMNSPRQCLKCSEEVSDDRLSVTILNSSSMAINSTVNDDSHAEEITKEVLKYVFIKLGKILNVRTVDSGEVTIEDDVQKLNEIFGQEVACASEVERRVFVVFPNSDEEIVKQHLQIYEDDSQHNVVQQTVSLGRVFKKFQKEIYSCFNTNISYKFEEVDNQLICTLSGPETHVDSAVRRLQQIKADLKYIDIKVNKRKREALKHLNIENSVEYILKTSFPNCVFEQTDECLRVHSFESSVLSDASDYVENLILDDVFQVKENSKHLTGMIVKHLQNKFTGKLIADSDNESRLYLFGLRPDVDEARSEIVNIHEGRVSLNAAMVDEHVLQTCTDIYEVRSSKHIKYFQHSVFIEKIENNFSVRISFLPEKFIININGVEVNVKKALKCFKKIGQELKTDIYMVSQDAAVHFFESDASSGFFHSVERESDVYIEKQTETIFGDEKLHVTKKKYDEFNEWTMSKDRTLSLEQHSIEYVKADVKIIPSAHDTKQQDIDLNAPIVKGQHFVNVRFPEMTSECDKFNETLERIFRELSTTTNKSVAISLAEKGKCEFNLLMACTVNFALKWLLSDPNRKPNRLLLCSGKEKFTPTDVNIDDCLGKMISDFHNKDEVDVTVCEGELHKVKADVLVNTVSANLDLSKGRVSAAVLKTAGNDLQKECRTKYQNGIRYGEIAITKGYDTGCKEIYHMALQPYSQKSMKDCIMNMRTAMTSCLCTATDRGYTSIAFPAIGTGSLAYPVELVAAEMFGCVERFKLDYPRTTLKVIKFVIYYKDVELLQYFKKIKMDDAKSITSNRQIRIKILGIEANILHSRKCLEEKVQELNKLRDKENPGILSTSYTNPEQTKENTIYYRKQSSDSMTRTSKTNNIQKSSFEGSDIHVSNNRMEIRGEKSKYQRRKPPYERHKDKDAKHLDIFKCNECHVHVYTNDITNARVDCKVSATKGRTEYFHNNGSAAGENVKGEANCWIDQNSVIYAVFPCWNNYKPMTKSNLKKCTEFIRKTVIDCLQLAEDRSIRSIAFPSVTSGPFEIPQDVCAIQFAEALKIFTRNNSIVNEIHFIGESLDMVKILKVAFTDIIVYGKQSSYDINVYLEPSSEDGLGTLVENKKKVTKYTALSDTAISKHETQACYIENKNTLRYLFSPGKVFDVYDADILSVADVEAIVCSENKRGDAKGTIARALLNEEDDRYRTEKQSAFESLTSYADVITTRGTCGFKWVLHAVVPRHKDKIQVVYRNVFKEAKNRNITSLAVPLLGTGNRDMDPLTSAEILLSEMINFFNQSINDQFILHVHVVVNDPQIATVMNELFKTFIDDMKKSHACKDVQRTVPVFEEIRVKSLACKEGREELEDEMKTKPCTLTINSAKKVEEEPGDECVICMDKVTEEMKLICGHTFCRECIEGYFRVRKVCPTCGKVCGVITGDQPDGKMEIVKRKTQLAGYEGYKSLAITYNFASGKQGADHPKPGAPYRAITRTAFLPDNMEGREICALLKVAFERRLVFTIGTSRTTGQEGVITWNDIHHKTDPRPNTQFGYPDNTYLRRVREELEVKGVTGEDIDKKFIKKLDKDYCREIIC